MTDTNTVPVNRHALVRAPAAEIDRVRRYLPSNYHVALNAGIYGEGILIEGHDVAGWTLDDYVLPRLGSGMLWASEVFYCASCMSHEHNIGDCPEQIPVFAVMVDGDDYHVVAHDLDGLKLMVGTHASFGQCRDCGSFDPVSGSPVAFTLTMTHATCDGCDRRYLIVSKPSKEVCF